jgi:hypothetical protein
MAIPEDNTEWTTIRRRLFNPKANGRDENDKEPDTRSKEPTATTSSGMFRGPSPPLSSPSKQRKRMNRDDKRPKRRRNITRIDQPPLDRTHGARTNGILDESIGDRQQSQALDKVCSVSEAWLGGEGYRR